MQFNDDVRVYKGTVTKVKQLRHKTVYVCEYDDADTVQHTEEELRIALRGESDQRQTLKTAPKCAARRAYSTLHACIYHTPRPILMRVSPKTAQQGSRHLRHPE